jgi:hypothetical protein
MAWIYNRRNGELRLEFDSEHRVWHTMSSIEAADMTAPPDALPLGDYMIGLPHSREELGMCVMVLTEPNGDGKGRVIHGNRRVRDFGRKWGHVILDFSLRVMIAESGIKIFRVTE